MKEFSSFEGFAAHLAGLAATQAIASEHMMEGVAKVVERCAKEKIGDYQGQHGPFAAWAELADSTKADRERQGYPEDEPGLRSGEMRDSIEHRSNAEEAQVGSDNDKLVYFELGTDKQPPRSVLGGAAFELAPDIVERIGKAYTAHLRGEGVHDGSMLITAS